MSHIPESHQVESLPDTNHQEQCQRINTWTRWLILVLVVCMLGILLRVGQLKLHPDERLRSLAGHPFSSAKELAHRGEILDRKGRTIATSLRGYRLFVDPQFVEDPLTVAVDIAHIIKIDPVSIDMAIHRYPDSRYVIIDDELDNWQVEALRNARLKGVGLTERLVRHYPHGELARGLVGKVRIDHIGLSGIENRFEEKLAPEHGKLTYLRDVQRQALWIEPADYQPRDHGTDVQLSIDLVIQDIAERRLRQAVLEYNAGGGRILAVDPRTGEILAMYDMLNPRPGWDEQTEDELREQDPALGRNRCITDPYEPGSTFKPFIWSTVTELGLAQLEEVLPTPSSTGHVTSYGRLIRDSHYYGPSSWRRVLVKSMNSGMAIIAERMTHNQLQQAVSHFGFGQKTYCGMPGESPGIVTPPKAWTKYTQSSVAMGHEIAVTPVQMVQAFCAFARDGTFPTLRITAVREENQQYQIVHRSITPPTARLTREILREVMWEGTGRRAQSEKYQLFGKSGTAQLPRKTGGGYHEDRYASNFIAGAPYVDPQIIVLCVIDDPDKSKGHYGGEIAGPVVRDVIDAALTYMGVPGDVADYQKDQSLVYQSPSGNAVLVNQSG